MKRTISGLLALLLLFSAFITSVTTPVYATETNIKDETIEERFERQKKIDGELVEKMAKEARTQLETIDSDSLVDKIVNFIQTAYEKAKDFGLIEKFIVFFKSLVKTVIELIKGLLDAFLSK